MLRLWPCQSTRFRNSAPATGEFRVAGAGGFDGTCGNRQLLLKRRLVGKIRKFDTAIHR